MRDDLTKDHDVTHRPPDAAAQTAESEDSRGAENVVSALSLHSEPSDVERKRIEAKRPDRGWGCLEVRGVLGSSRVAIPPIGLDSTLSFVRYGTNFRNVTVGLRFLFRFSKYKEVRTVDPDRINRTVAKAIGIPVPTS